MDVFKTLLLSPPGAIGSSVAITGGSINGTNIGATTPGTGAFTTLTASGATTLTAGTASTNTTSGTLVVTGGLGVSGAGYFGANINVNVADAKLIVNDVGGATSASIQLIRGAATAIISNDSNLNITPASGGLVYFNGIAVANNSTDTSSSTTGSLQARGGLGVAKKIFCADTTASTTTTTGAVIIGGGIGAAGAINVGTYYGMVDGIAAPGATVGYAKIYVDTADGDLKVVFGDGTVKTIATDT